MTPSVRRVTINFYLDNEIDVEVLREEVRDIIKDVSDYQYDNISCHTDIRDEFGQALEINAFPEDFRNIAGSRKVLTEVFQKLLYKFT